MNLFEELNSALKYNGVVDLAAVGRRTLAKNVECFVAQYFIHHPKADPKDLVLVYRPSLKDPSVFNYEVFIQEKTK